MNAAQLLNAQSALVAQPSPLGHVCGGETSKQEPPQSLPVSCPFWTPSLQLGALHPAYQQTPLSQSVPLLQGELSGHALHPPPQSLAVSLPFRMPSSQVAATQ